MIKTLLRQKKRLIWKELFTHFSYCSAKSIHFCHFLFMCVLSKPKGRMKKLTTSEWACPWLRLKSELVRNEQQRKPLRWTGERGTSCSAACNHLNLYACYPSSDSQNFVFICVWKVFIKNLWKCSVKQYYDYIHFASCLCRLDGKMMENLSNY